MGGHANLSGLMTKQKSALRQRHGLVATRTTLFLAENLTATPFALFPGSMFPIIRNPHAGMQTLSDLKIRQLRLVISKSIS
jgi:hypothetical protein